MRDRPSATVLALAVLLILYVGLCPASAKKPSGPIRTGAALRCGRSSFDLA